MNTTNDAVERCQCCGRPKDDWLAFQEIMATMRADGNERTHRLGVVAEEIKYPWLRDRPEG